VSPGILGSFDLSHRGAFGLGAEVSYSKLVDVNRWAGFGAFLNAIHFFAPVRGRFSAGGQANYGPAGVEAGWSLSSASNADYGLGTSTGPLIGRVRFAGDLDGRDPGLVRFVR
jgi:hypothetical protein